MVVLRRCRRVVVVAVLMGKNERRDFRIVCQTCQYRIRKGLPCILRFHCHRTIDWRCFWEIPPWYGRNIQQRIVVSTFDVSAATKMARTQSCVFEMPNGRIPPIFRPAVVGQVMKQDETNQPRTRGATIRCFFRQNIYHRFH